MTKLGVYANKDSGVSVPGGGPLSVMKVFGKPLHIPTQRHSAL